jgi:Secretion system C-terminal sorting domain/Concanavalin A-like lectin/glucanases superfamily
MARSLLVALIVCASYFAFAQTPTYRYEFNGNLSSQTAGPNLSTKGLGSFVVDNVPSNPLPDTVYQFNKNAGITFTDAADTVLSDSTYTLEMLVKFNDLNNWSRVVDFFGGTSDEGIYALNGKINYYARALTSTSSIKDGQYIHLTVMRNNATKGLRVFANGTFAYTVFDTFGVAIGYGNPRKVNFFADDTAVGNEASAGTIAWLNVYDNILTDSAINVKAVLATTQVTSVANLVDNKNISVYPNPTNGTINFIGLSYGSSAEIYNAQGSLVYTALYTAQAIDISFLSKGAYWVKVQGATGAMRLILE